MSDPESSGDLPTVGPAGIGGGAAADDSLVGTTLGGKYLVEKMIGKGGMGAVYRAKQVDLGRNVAIKVLRPEISEGRLAIERFRREAQATALLRHPNIVTVYDFDQTDDGRIYLVMEFLEGPPLHHWIEDNPYPEPADVVAIFKPVCSAIDAMHRAKVVHRDIKPSNIILPDPNDADDVVKVLDLGIARFTEQNTGADLTGTLVIGTAFYMAPEVATGKKAGPPADLYSIAVTAYEAMTGMLPFDADNPRAALFAHAGETPQLATERRPSLPKAVDEVFVRALDKDPDVRYPTGKDFANALEAAIVGDAYVTNFVDPVRTLPPEPARPIALVVDDDPDLRMMVGDCLESAGFDVEVAADGVEALLRLGAKTFDLIVSDVSMPNLDGLTFLRFKRDKGIATPIIMLTANESTEDEVMGLELGAADYIKKPFTVAPFLARVRRVVEKHSS